ncbi:MAG: hypothetical protein LBR29_00270 [Methylobacteriaceae bacterium]|jgi:SH3-like domain-containing protein|nr:hypothetical protein [Methylobacteriaceae bacterium]
MGHVPYFIHGHRAVFRKAPRALPGTACLVAVLLGLAASGASAQAIAARKGTGLPVPRFVSLKSNLVNVRRGASNDHAITAIYKKRGLPVEIVAEWDNWRKIRDSEGTEGWVWHSLLSGERTALVSPWSGSSEETFHITAEPDSSGRTVARVRPGVVVSVKSCDKQWCTVRLTWEKRDYQGFFPQNRLWGVYPDEEFE